MRRATLAVLLALSLAACAGAPPERPAPAQPKAVVTPEMLRLADMALDDGLAEEARQRYGRLLAIEPGSEPARLGLGEAYLALGDDGRALEQFTAVAETPPKALQGRGLALARLGRDRDAQAALEDAVAAEPALWRAWNALGGLHDRAGRFERADAAYAEALRLRPESGAVRNNMGYSLLLRSRPGEAVPLFIEALAREPRLDVAQANLRLALALDGRYEDARFGLTRESRAESLNNIGYVALSRGDYDQAEILLVQAIESSPSFHHRAAANLVRVRALKGG